MVGIDYRLIAKSEFVTAGAHACECAMLNFICFRLLCQQLITLGLHICHFSILDSLEAEPYRVNSCHMIFHLIIVMTHAFMGIAS
jgi:hypothetical protein